MKKLRQEFADTMLEVGFTDPKLIVMVADISHGILKPYAKAYPKRYYNIGICEPSIVSMAAGLNRVGFVPVVHTIAPFITERAYEQIKLDFGYQKLDLNLISVGGAFDYSKLGCSHHCYTDVSLISHLSRSVVVMPGSPIEFNKIFKQIYKNNSINYFKLPDKPHNIEFKPQDIIFGKSIKVKEGKDVTISVVGSQLTNAIIAADKLKKFNISAEILYFHTIKPFDNEALRQSLKKTKRLVTVEELSAHDGLFNLCLKSLIGIDGIKFEQLAIKDFLHDYGSYEDLCKKAGLTYENIEKAALRIVGK